MDLEFEVYERYVTAILGMEASLTNYFGKEIHVYLFDNPSRFVLFLENPTFYNIINYIVDAYLKSKKVTIKLFVDEIHSIPHLKFTEEEKKAQAMEASYYVFKNETDMVTHSWQAYPGYTDEKKTKFWKRWLSKQMRRLDFYGFDPYYLYQQKLYDFWKHHEPNLNSFLNQIVEIRELDRSKIEESLGFKIK
ncbi:MAG TPA: hypothetical protein DCS93_43515 [Microscillaceae bacterium]|nr:hypothetical protein [Microscillaceae bacterium]